MKKITVITGIFYPEIGGPSTYLKQLLTDLTSDGLAEITVITYGDDTTISYPFKVIKTSRSWPLVIKFVLFTLRCFLHGRNADIWFVNDYGFPAALANVFLRKRMIMKIVGDFAWEFSMNHKYISDIGIDEFQGYTSSWRANIVKRIQRYYASKAELIVTPSNYLKRIIAGWGIDSNKIVVVYNALRMEKYVTSLSKEDARKEFTLPQDKIIILTIARLTTWKKIDHVLYKFAQLDDSHYYVIAGLGPEMERLKGITQKLNLGKRVLFLGQVPHDRIPSLLKASDIFVLNSEYEGLPHVILEAAALGLPSLISNQEGSKEVVEKAKCGFVIGDDFKSDVEKALHVKQITLPEEFRWDYLFSRMTRILEVDGREIK